MKKVASKIVFFVFFAIPILFPQAGNALTLCDQHKDVTYKLIFGGTPATNGLVSGQTGVKIWLKGNLTIDQNFSMNGWDIRASAGTSIIVNNNISLTVNNSDLFCCSGLWNGIVLKQAAKLEMTNSNVEDAEAAISSRASNFKLSLWSNTFNRNKNGIYCLSSSYSFMDIATFESNTFSCTSARNDGAIESDAGIAAYNTVSSILAGFPNYFTNQKYGFLLSKCHFEVKGCSFTDCEYGIYLSKGTTLTQRGLGKSASIPTFNNCDYAIRSIDSGFSARENRVVNPSAVGFRTSGTAKSSIVITDNYFEQKSNDVAASSIRLEGSSSYIDLIQGNDFNIINAIYAILVTGSYNNSNKLRILNNGFDYVETSELTELFLGGASCSLEFKDNVLNNTTGIGMTIGAYHFHNLSPMAMHSVEHNTSISNGNNPHSFYVVNSAMDFCDNTTGGATNGFTFSSSCLGTVLGESHVGAHSVGVNIGNQIGPQNIKGNCWLNNNNYSSKAIICSGATPLASLFTVDPSISCHYPQGSITPANLFDPNGIGAEPCAVLANGLLNELDIKIANGQIANEMTNPVELWNAQRYLFRKLYLNPELMPAGSLAASFYQTHAAGKVGQFHDAEVAWAAAGVLPSGMEAQHHAVLNGLNSKLLEMANVNALLLAQPNDAALEAQKSAAIEAVLLKAEELESILTVAQNAITFQKNNALSVINALTCDNIWQQNEKRVRYLSLLSSLDDREFTEAELEELRDIAEQCPQQGGTFVTTARTFIPLEEQYIYEVNMADFNCPPSLPLKVPPTSINSAISDGLVVSPNPASDYVTIQFPSAVIGEVRVLDMQGRILLTKKIAEGDADLFLDTSRWPVGVYQFQVMENGKFNALNRVVINR